MKAGVGIYGGFAGTESSRSQRNWQTNLTTLSGDIGTSSDYSDNSYHVVTSSGLNASAVLDGFTISYGNANGTGFTTDEHGGGMYNTNTSPIIINCIFSYNKGIYDAGLINVSSSPTITDCTFSDNEGGNSGGMKNESKSHPVVKDCNFINNEGSYGSGMYNNGKSNPTVIRCTFSGNKSLTGNGGGIYNNESSPILADCIFSGNTAMSGGGMQNENNSYPTVTNCTFSKNSATGSGIGMGCGGGMGCNGNSSPTVTNCTFSENSAIGSGGGIYSFYTPNSKVNNCTFFKNTASDGGGMYNDDLAPSVTNSTFSGNTATNDGGGIYSNNSSPLITNCTIFNNTATNGGGLYNDSTSSPATANCILWNNSSDEIYDETGSSPTVIYSIVKGGYAGSGNIDEDPLFEDSAAQDFHLQEGSPAINTGSNAAIPSGITTDIDGNTRIFKGIVDMGAYEYSVSTVPPVTPGPPLPIVITAEVSDITANEAASGGNVIYPEGCTVLLVGRGVTWDTVSPPTYPQDAHTFDGWASGEYTSSLTNLVPQTKYYIRAYVMYKLNGVVYTRYSEYIYNFTTPALPGDVNGDKILDLKDAILALKIVAGAAGNAAINLPADVNGDGKIGIEEAVYVLQNVGRAG